MRRPSTAALGLVFGVIACCAGAVLHAAPGQRGFEEDSESSRLWRVRSWVSAVEDHEPGKPDAAALSVNDWSSADLRELQEDLQALTRILASARKSRDAKTSFTPPKHQGRVITLEELQGLLDLSDEELANGDANGLLERGAMFHADIAILAPPKAFDPAGPLDSGVVFLYRDGRLEGVETGGVHWSFARGLLDLVKPDPSLNDWVRLWYRATGAYLQMYQRFHYAHPHLDRARKLFPADAEILLYSGSINEDYATPEMQAVSAQYEYENRAQVTGTQATTVIRPARRELQDAQTLFRQALKSDPTLVEVRVRLGFVLEQLGRHQEAATELQTAAKAADDSQLRFYANLFLGQAEAGLGHDDVARGAFERACELYPRAQSSRLALSHLARGRGDRAAALGAIQDVLSQPNHGDSDDPWWVYYRMHVRTPDSLLDQVRALVPPARPQ
jgi:tetratricopeptide (TPR) repeat protein